MFSPVDLSSLGLPFGYSGQSTDKTQSETQTEHRHRKVAPTAEPQSTGVRISAKERFQSAESFSLSLKTQDGDTVTIEFSSEVEYKARYREASSSENGHVSSSMRYSIDRQSSSEYGFSVEGDLDVEELDAIANLVQDLSLLADEFFNGDLQAGMGLLDSIRFDTEQLSSMNFSMEQNLSYEAITTYKEVQNMGPRVDQASDRGDKALRAYGMALVEQISKAESHVEYSQEFTISLMESLIQSDSRFTQSSALEQVSMKQGIHILQALVETGITQFGESEGLSEQQEGDD